MQNAAQSAVSGSRPSPNHLPAELLVLVGKIAIQSAYVDMLLGELLSGPKNVKWEDRQGIHAIDTRRKTEQAKAEAIAVLPDLDKNGVLALLARVGDLLADRNLVIHGVIAYPDEKLTNPLYVAFRGKHAGKETPFSKQTLEPIFNDLEEASRELMAACEKFGLFGQPPSP